MTAPHCLPVLQKNSSFHMDVPAAAPVDRHGSCSKRHDSLKAPLRRYKHQPKHIAAYLSTLLPGERIVLVRMRSLCRTLADPLCFESFDVDVGKSNTATNLQPMPHAHWHLLRSCGR